MITNRYIYIEYIWLAHPMPKPRRRRPTMSIYTLWAKPLMSAPAQKSTPPESIVARLPKRLVIDVAKIDEIKAARYSDDVNNVNVWLLNLQYWSSDAFDEASFLYTAGKNFSRNESMEVTPPIIYHTIISNSILKKKKSNQNPRYPETKKINNK